MGGYNSNIVLPPIKAYFGSRSCLKVNLTKNIVTTNIKTITAFQGRINLLEQYNYYNVHAYTRLTSVIAYEASK